MLKNLLEVPASTAEASTPVEVAAEAVQRIEKQIGETTGTRIQGLPADVYAAHPNWTEDFLTVNEYSRPGDPLTEVKNIFVHYTANPGTSAAQNRSYFEQLKVPILSLAMMARFFSAFLWTRSPMQYRPAMRILFLSNAATRRTTASLLRRPMIL